MLADRVIDLCLDVFDRSILMMGPLLLLLGWSLVNVVAYLFFTIPFVSFDTQPTIIVILVNSIGIWLWFNILFNWILCWKTKPGFAPPKTQEDNNNIQSCQKCDSYKPARAHHCHVCQRCILAMDHHCPWMANCIGFFNYRYFVLTLVYLTVGCAYCILISCIRFDIPSKVLYRDMQAIPKDVFFVFFLCTCAGCAVLILLTWHIYLIFSGQTTIEFYQRRSTVLSRKSKRRSCGCWFLRSSTILENNDYDLGPIQNWERVFGKSKIPFEWALPSFQLPQGDGIHWKNCRSLIEHSIV